MRYTAKDIEILILTYNRSNFLKQTIESILVQSVQGFRLCVFDNYSSDGTVSMLEKSFLKKAEVFKSVETMPSLFNFERAVKAANRKWTIVFHDDDIMHPDYIASILKTINSYPNLALLGSTQFGTRKIKPIWKKNSFEVNYFYSAKDFAKALYSGSGFCFPTAVYKTEILKKTPLNFALYNKWFDRPLLLDISEQGDVAVFKKPFIKYRIHPNQDSKFGVCSMTEYIFNLNKKYYSILGSKLFSKYGLTFVFNCYAAFKCSGLIRHGQYNDLLLNLIPGKVLFWGKVSYPFFLIRKYIRKGRTFLARKCFNIK